MIKNIFLFSLITMISMPVMAEKLVVKQPTTAPSAKATLVDSENKDIGTVTFTQASKGVLIRIKASGLTPGVHGMHIHATGECTHADHFTKAGSHLGSKDETHGLLSPHPHAGDLPNIIAAKDGTAEAEIFTTWVSLNGQGGLPALRDKDGAALIIHAKADDYATQPTGNSGDRIACGVIN